MNESLMQSTENLELNMKEFYTNSISGLLSGEILFSEKYYKIIGLKCLPEDLPESLYFMLIDNMNFRIPYFSNERDIITFNLDKNIKLISKILSYFEIEEIDKTSEINSKDVEVVSFIDNIVNSNMKFTKDQKRKWMIQQINLFEQHYRKDKDMPSKMGKISSAFKKDDIAKYYVWKSHNPIKEVVEKILDDNTILKNKSINLPSSIKKFLLGLSESFEDSINTAFKHLKYIVSENQTKTTTSLSSTFLYKILTTYYEKFENENLYNSKFFLEKSMLEEGVNSTFDLLNKQLDSGFKYTDANIEVYKKANYFIDLYPLTNFDLGYEIFDKYNLSTDKTFIEIMNESYKNLDMFNISKMNPEDTSGLGYMHSSFYNTIHIILDYFMHQSGGPTILPITMAKEPGCNIETISLKYKDMINLEWSEELTRTVKFTTKDIEESIRHRYYFTSVNRNSSFLDQRNLVIDTMLPEIMFKNNLDIEKINRGFQNSSNLFTKTAYAISPLTASVLGCKAIPIEHLCRILGYTKDNIKSMMSIIKNRSFNFVFVGTGGTGNNTAIWLSRMLEMSNLPYLFNQVYAFEKEAAELHNLLRFPKDPYTITIDSGIFASSLNEETKKNKCNIIAGELRSLSKNIPCCYERYIADSESHTSFPSNVFSRSTTTEPVLDNNGNTIDFASVTKIKPELNTIFYGAPSINTREKLSEIGNFISATHSSNSCNIYINPEQDATIQVESYGMIQLSPFFMNQLRMAIGLLEILSADDTFELLAKKDYEFLSYQFDGESRLKNDRIYNFKIIGNTEMATENQTQNLNLNF